MIISKTAEQAHGIRTGDSSAVVDLCTLHTGKEKKKKEDEDSPSRTPSVACPDRMGWSSILMPSSMMHVSDGSLAERRSSDTRPVAISIRTRWQSARGTRAHTPRRGGGARTRHKPVEAARVPLDTQPAARSRRSPNNELRSNAHTHTREKKKKKSSSTVLITRVKKGRGKCPAAPRIPDASRDNRRGQSLSAVTCSEQRTERALSSRPRREEAGDFLHGRAECR